MTKISVAPAKVHDTLRQHMLVDGFDFVLDTQKSQGRRVIDAKTGRSYLDFFSFFASSPVGMNHPKMRTEAFKEKMIEAATNNPSNSDVYTTIMAEFVATLDRIAIPEYLPHLFLVSGGALAVENALKTAFDWKARKQHPKGFSSVQEEEKFVNSMKVVYFREAFHGRTGYTMSMTNTYYRFKVQYFPKFEWINAPNPKLAFPLNDERLRDVEKREKESLDYIRREIKKNAGRVAAMIIEPIQAEGGDNHFRKEFHQALRDLCDENEIILIYDEVQTGVGLTGTFWAHEGIGVRPDILAFGKKMQVCGILASRRIDEVADNVFVKAGRINSTWGGNLADMFRSTTYLEIIEEENLVTNAKIQGQQLLEGLQTLERDIDKVTNARGSGLMCAFDLPSEAMRDRFHKMTMENGLLVLKCGEKSIRFRPSLNVSSPEVDEALAIMRKTFSEISS